jgi:DNA polymerase-3 subunit beta
MELKIARQDLEKALDVVSGVVSPRPTNPILGNLLMDARKQEVVVTATDLEVGITLSTPATVKREGKFTVPAKKFLEVVREMPEDEIHLESDSASRVLLKSGAADIRLLGLPPDEFPSLPEVKPEAEVKIPCATLVRMIDKTLYAASADETRYVLNGAYLVWEKGEARMVATDGRRLSYVRAPLAGATGRGEAIVPTKALQELVKLLAGGEGDVTVARGEPYARFSAGTAALTARLIDGHFPDYEQVIPRKQDKSIRLKTADFLAAVRRAALVAADRSSSVRLDVRKGLVTFSAASHELGEAREDVSVQYDGEPLAVAYNARFLQDILRHIDADETVLELSTALAPGVLKPAGDETYTCVVMPIRL